MVGESKSLSSPAATISPFPWSEFIRPWRILDVPPEAGRHGVDVARQAAAGFGCMAALEAEKWLREQEK